MPPSRLEITVNGIPVGRFTPFEWHREDKYLLWLKRIELSYRQTLTATAQYSYFLSIERHAGYTVVIIHPFGQTWLIHIAKRQFYVEHVHPETE